MKKEKKVIVITVANKAGVLNRVTSLLRRRTFNIESLTVAKTDNPLFSRMTICLEGEVNIEQVTKQLHKLIDVIKVFDMPESTTLFHESLFLKVSVSRSKRPNLLTCADVFSPKVVDVAEKSITFQLSDHPDVLEKFIELMKPFGIKEFIRSGAMAIYKS